MREGGNVRGINTAATLWGSAAIGACAGADLIMEAVLGTLFVLSANTLLRPIVSRINRQPLDLDSLEVTNTVYIIAMRDEQNDARHLLEESLRTANYPAHQVVMHAFGEGQIEIEATLMTQSVNREDLDLLVAKLADNPKIKQAFWSPSTSE